VVVTPSPPGFRCVMRVELDIAYRRQTIATWRRGNVVVWEGIRVPSPVQASDRRVMACPDWESDAIRYRRPWKQVYGP